MRTLVTTRRGMGLGALGPFCALAFGLGWGIVGLLILVTDRIEALFGPVSGTNPVFILAVYSPGIAGVFLVWQHYGLHGLASYLRRLALWRMPLVDDYDEQLKSAIADADNAPGGPGAVIAALFLRHFVGDLPWAHLDIASVGDSPTDLHEWTTGPTGFGARALLHWLETKEPLTGVAARRTSRRR